MPFISVDIEASGSIPGVFDMLSFGAVKILDNNGTLTVSNNELYIELKPYYGGVDPFAMQVNKMDIEKLKQHGVNFEDAAKIIKNWVLEGSSKKDPPVFVGYCANFDWAFVNDLFLRTNIENPFGYKALDIRALAMGILKLPWLSLNQENILPLLNMKPLDKELAHHALVDARHQGFMLCSLLEKMGIPNTLAY